MPRIDRGWSLPALSPRRRGGSENCRVGQARPTWRKDGQPSGNGYLAYVTDFQQQAGGGIVSLKNVDPESLALSTNAEFMAIIEHARRECAAGQTISLSAMKKQLGV